MERTQLSYKWLFSQFKYIRRQAKRYHLIKGTVPRVFKEGEIYPIHLLSHTFS